MGQPNGEDVPRTTYSSAAESFVIVKELCNIFNILLEEAVFLRLS